MQEVSADNAPVSKVKLPWHRTVVGKVAIFMLLGVVFAYLMGAMLGFTMVERSARDQWGREAQVNAQIVSATIRRIYTAVAVRTDSTGQVNQLVSARPIGDEDSVLSTGFSPIDVLALASAQTRRNVWLFAREANGSITPVADAFNNAVGDIVFLDISELPKSLSANEFYVWFARIGNEEHFVSSLPITTPQGNLHGIVVSSIGLKSELYQVHRDLILKVVASLVLVLLATALLVSMLMKRLFKPVPRLIRALTHIAHNQTEHATPYTQRSDEIGCMAQAIEALRKKVEEREHLLEVKEQALRYQHLAHHDDLTKLPNRVQFNDALQEAVSQVPHGTSFNVMIFDLDRFKAVNDTLGHAAGDALLVEASQRVQGLLEENDLVARLGGDEFSIIQQANRDALAKANRLAHQLVEVLQEPFAIDGHDVSIGVSVGIALAPRDGTSSHTLLRSADVALYTAKAMGRGRYAVFSPGMTMGAEHHDR
jgi:diguanylate cyclase (GGDEF)-like protein